MKAAVIEKPYTIKIKDMDIPCIKSDEVLVKVQVASICNATDNHIFHGIFDGYHDYYPQIVGHEVAGEVVQVGAEVTELHMGDLVALYTPRGAFCEYTVVKPSTDLWVHIYDTMPLKIRSAVEMYHGAYVSLVHPAQIKKDETVLIVGQGPMGLTAAATSRLTAKKIITVDLNPFRLLKSLEVGADIALNRNDMSAQEIIDIVKRETDGNGVDIALMCISEDRSKETDSFDMAINAMRRGGRMSGLFVDAKGIGSNHHINPRLLLRKEAVFSHTLNGVYHTKQDQLVAFQDIVDKTAMGKVKLESLITHEIRFDEIEKALNLCLQNMNETIKIVAYP